MELKIVLSVLTLVLFLITLFFSLSVRRTYLLFILFMFPLIDLNILPEKWGGFSLFDVMSFICLVFIINSSTNHNQTRLYFYLFCSLAVIVFIGSISSNFAYYSLLSYIKFFPIFIYAKALLDECFVDPSFSKKVISVLRFVSIISIVFLLIQMTIGLKFTFYSKLNPNTIADDVIRYPGYFDDAQEHGQYLAMISFLFLINCKKQFLSNLKNYFAFTCIIGALIITGGRAAFLGFCLGFIFLFLTAGANIRVFTLICCFGGYLTFKLFSDNIVLFSRGETYGADYEFRKSIWHDALEIFDANPLLGIGIGNYQNYVSIYDQDQVWEFYENGIVNDVLYYDQPESGYLKILTEYGIIGFVITISFFIIPILKAIKNYIGQKANVDIFYFIASIISWMVSFITTYSLSDKRILVLLATVVCLLIVHSRKGVLK